MKDHEIRELVNKLTDVAKTYHGHQSLRERIAHVVRDAVPRGKCDALQAKIDALMLEHCPEEMTEEQMAEWARHQQAVDEQGDPIAWESTTVCFEKYVSDRRYNLFSDEAKRWYKPYRCSSCEAKPVAEHGCGCGQGQCCAKCDPDLSSVAKPAPRAEPSRQLLRNIVDAVWNAATESEQVPSTDWADQIIDKEIAAIPKTATEPDSDRVAELEAEVQRLAGEVSNRNRRALEGDEAKAAFDRLYGELEACQPYLKLGESPAQRIQREIDDCAAVTALLAKEKTENERLLRVIESMMRDFPDDQTATDVVEDK